MANRQQFSMVCILIDHKDDVKKVQNFAVKPLDRLRLVFPVEFEHHDVISIVDKSKDHVKLLSNF